MELPADAVAVINQIHRREPEAKWLYPISWGADYFMDVTNIVGHRPGGITDTPAKPKLHRNLKAFGVRYVAYSDYVPHYHRFPEGKLPFLFFQIEDRRLASYDMQYLDLVYASNPHPICSHCGAAYIFRVK